MSDNFQNCIYPIKNENSVNKEKRKEKKVQKALESFSYIKIESVNKICFYKNKKSKNVSYQKTHKLII